MALHARTVAVIAAMGTKAGIATFLADLSAGNPAAAARVSAEAESVVSRRLATATGTSAAELGRLSVKELKTVALVLGVQPVAGMLKAELLKEVIEHHAALTTVAERGDLTKLHSSQHRQIITALIEEAHRAQGLGLVKAG